MPRPTGSKPTFRVRYELLLAELVVGRIRGQRTVRGSLVASTNELAVLLADLYEQFRATSCLMGIHILSVRRQPTAGR